MSRCSRSGPFGILNGTPLSATCTLARVIRRVMVASGTRKARAISAVVSPPTARRVSAICEAGDSAGWQHRNSRMSVSSDSAAGVSAAGASHSAGGICRAAASSRRCLACSLRSRSVSRREATVISQPRGLPGMPSAGHCGGGRQQRLLHRVLGGVEMPVAAHQRAEDLRRQLAEQVLGFAVAHGQGSRSAWDSATGRTST